MKCYEFKDPNVFYKEVAPVLMKNEVINSLPLGILNALVTKPADHGFKERPFMAYIGEEHDPKLVLLMTPPNHLVLSGLDRNIEKLISIALDYIIQNRIEFPSVIGISSIVNPFVEGCKERTGKNVKIDMSQRIYKLEKVDAIPISSGFLRVASKRDMNIVSDWITQFAREAIHEDKDETFGRERAHRGIRNQSLFVWEDSGKIVSMVSKTKPTENGITVSLVYTPQELRGKGYASSAVAALSQQLLDEGYKYCCLYTDLTNPTSNSIYQKIGYRPLADSMVYRFGL